MSGEVFALTESEVSLGRDSSNGISFPDPALSRRQCVFTHTDGAWMLNDLNSSNGTFVNGLQITSHRLTEGDRVSVGGSVLLFVAHPVVETPRDDINLIESEPGRQTERLALDDTKYLRPPAVQARPSRTELGLRALLRLSALVHSATTEANLYRDLATLLGEMIPADLVAVLLVGDDGGIESVYRNAPGGGAVDVNRAVVGQVMKERTGVLSTGASTISSASDAPAGSRPAVLCAPLEAGDRAVGVLFLASRAGAFENEDLQLLTAVSRLSATAVANVRRLAMLQTETERLKADLQLKTNLVGDSEPMRRVYDTIGRVARADSNVLIAGETGTGKELAARAIHLNSRRASRPFVAINCAALTESLLESELFGHERGSFSGAIAQKKGRLEVADGGTVFLDEIGEMPASMQSKLLRVLQLREFERVGGTRTIKVDIRLVAATNRDLVSEARAGRFREDLYFRLNVVTIQMPALRERPSDIPALAHYFLSRCKAKAGRRISGISSAALACLRAYDWPGNVRELENTIERAAVLGTTEEILPEDLPDSVIEAAVSPVPPVTADNIHAAVLETKKKAILDAFRASGGNYTVTARALGVHPNYLHRLVRNLGLKSMLTANR
jgi:two-component system, NtrC family, response regulator HydG